LQVARYSYSYLAIFGASVILHSMLGSCCAHVVPAAFGLGGDIQTAAQDPTDYRGRFIGGAVARGGDATYARPSVAERGVCIVHWWILPSPGAGHSQQQLVAVDFGRMGKGRFQSAVGPFMLGYIRGWVRIGRAKSQRRRHPNPIARVGSRVVLYVYLDYAIR